jgi:predicted ribosome quality control (RQC) complex YloA/Tae2 family protein
MDGIAIYALVDQLRHLEDAKINKIHQPNEHELVWQMRHNGQNLKLILSAHPVYARVHLTTRNFTNPIEPPMFCMLLRKHLENAIIEKVAQVALERIIHIDIRHFDDLGDMRRKRIIIEWMGRHSNIILFDLERDLIIDGIHHVTPSVSAYRVIMPGYTYTPPPFQDKRNILESDQHDWRLALTDGSSSGNVLKHFLGFSPLLAEIVADETSVEQTILNLMKLKSFLLDKNWLPAVITSPKTAVHAIELPAHFAIERTFPTMSDALDFFYGERAERDALRQKCSDLFRFVQNERAKNESKWLKLHDTLTESTTADEYRIKGELLTASLHTVKRGDKVALVTNYYDEHQAVVEIALDPQLSPAENAQRYFRKYNKLKNSAVAVATQIEQCRSEIDYLNRLMQQLEQVEWTEIEEIREELIEQGYIRNRQRTKQKQRKKQKKDEKPHVLCCTSSEGVTIWVGKNNKQNDYVTMKLADNHDTWLHTKDIPGSHVVIHSKSFGDQTLKEAAHLAAYFSQARASSQVPVDYTVVRHVHKPNGAKPGYVIYEQQKTIYITPDDYLVNSLLSGATFFGR